MIAASTDSRRKIFSKVRVTEVVPAPEEPVMAMMGCLMDMAVSSGVDRIAEEPALLEERQVLARVARILRVVALDALDFLARAEHEADALVQSRRRRVE